MAPIILGNPGGLGPINNIIVPPRHQYTIDQLGGGVVVGNTANPDAFSSGTVQFDGTNVTINTSENGTNQYIQLSVADPSAAANAVFAGDNISLSTIGASTTVSVIGLDNYAVSWHSHLSSYIDLTNSTLFQQVSDNSLSLAASQSTLFLAATNSTLLQTVGAYLTTAANSTHIHGGASGTNITIGSSSNGLALSVGNYITTAANSTHIHGSISSVSTSGSNLVYTSASNGLTFGIPAWLTTAAGGNNLTLSGNTLGTLTEMNSGTVTIVGGNNITLSQDGNAFTIIGNAPGTGGAGTGFTSSSISGVNLAATLDSNGLSMLVPALLTTAMLSNAGSNFVGLNSSVVGGSMTMNSSGLTLSIPSATATADNRVYAGDYISLSSDGASSTISVINLQATSNMSLYQLMVNSTLSLGTNAANSFLNTAFSSLLQHTSVTSAITSNALNTSQSSLFQHTSATSAITTNAFNTSQSSLFQLTSLNSNSLGTSYTTHTHLYAATNHTHGSINIVGGIGMTSASNGLSVSLPSYLTTAANSAHTHGSVNLSLDGLSGTYSSVSNGLTLSLTNSTHVHPYINTSEAGSIYFVNSLGSNFTWSSSTSGNSTSIFGTAGGGVGANAITFSAGSSSGSLDNLVFSNSNNISFGLSGSTLTGSIPQGTVYFVDSNGISFGSSTNGISTTITASVNGATNAAGTGFTTITTSGVDVVGTLGTNGLSLGIPIYVTTDNILEIQAGTNVHTGPGRIAFGDNNNVSWGYSSGTGINSLNGTVSVSFVNAWLIEGNTVGTDITTYGTLMNFVAGSNITLSGSNNKIVIHGASGGTADTANAMNTSERGNYFYTSNNTFLTTAALSNHTHSDLYQSTGAYLTTAALSNHTHGNPTLNLTNISGTTASASNGLTLSLSVNTGYSASSQLTNTFAQTNHTHAYVGQGTTTASTAGSDIVMTLNSNGLSMGIPAWLTTARASTDAIGLNTAGTNITWTANSSGISINAAGYAGTNTGATNCSITANSSGISVNVPTGTVYFADSNGHSFSSSTGTGGTTIYIVT